MKRRSFLWTPAMVAASSSEGCEQVEQSAWELWGSAQKIELRELIGAAPAPASSAQLSTVQYHRPETWSFFLFAEIIEAEPAVAVGDLAINLDFLVTTGVGRAAWYTDPAPPALPTTAQGQQGFVRFGWRRTVGQAIAANSRKWTQTANTPVLDDNDAASTRRVVEWLAAQSINCTGLAAVPLFTGPPGSEQRLVIQCGSFFAPRTHVRPDWFSDQDDGERFAGGQLRGK